jgi:ribosomal protein S18 acetylase RimI-like enzyme
LTVGAAVHLGELRAEHRADVEAIVRATDVFSDDEVAVALELFDETIGAWSLVQGEWVRTAAAPFSLSRAPDYEFIGAFEGDGLIGYACFGATPSTEQTYDLYWIAVHPGAQRSGAGSVLMAEVERRLRARRARLLVVETSSRHDYGPTRRFYENRGYERAAQIADFYAPGDHRVVLSKSLS